MGTAKDFIQQVAVIPALKAKARQHYYNYHSALDGMSCGRALGEHISVQAAISKRRFNAIMDKLAEIDPTCPASRL